MCLLPFNGFVLSFARVLSCYGLWRTCISVATLGIRWLRILYRWVIPECKDPGENFAISIQITSYHVKTKYLMSYMFVHTVSDRCVSCQSKPCHIIQAEIISHHVNSKDIKVFHFRPVCFELVHAPQVVDFFARYSAVRGTGLLPLMIRPPNPLRILASDQWLAPEITSQDPAMMTLLVGNFSPHLRFGVVFGVLFLICSHCQMECFVLDASRR